jgi:hypothetical protein
MLQTACERLREEGLEALAEASYPETGDETGYTVAIVFDAPTEEQRERIMEVLREEFRAELNSLPAPLTRGETQL